MSIEEETMHLRRRLQQLAEEAGADPLAKRYLRRFGRLRLSPYRRVRVRVGDVLRGLGLRARPRIPAWLPGLKHLAGTEHAGPLLVWALDVDRDDLRRACLALQRIENDLLPRFVPVLVTDVADFAFFSRLGWLVEYVPKLSPPAAGFADRKVRYLASRYRGAAALPWSIGLVPDVTAERVLALIGATSDDPARANG